mmetsp:Transcript_43795/g.99010  ORF Transcript_43795/g.99010 Transcript_43795/m.99010 type:complete len:279 (-) Transcript_43795:121-957(-)|eukprot:CAMPEP_0172626936 /NCGR_PEP_ID=MMETSP1068-20121228/153398_1 /TAXON_ID=35684 /ORGANISM="Pseudopedinella elastica, Strain CCMP716" /LENGTH=278 /DNA_ID=CAMNT_0013436679 /DNA_START=143 /DNA_END=979 /DNA_ORIENTATION=+
MAARYRLFAGAGVSASLFAGFTYARRVKSKDPSEPSVEESCRKLGLPTPAEAQRTQVVQLPNFMAPEEIDELVAAVRRVQEHHRAGKVERGSKGETRVVGVWRTTYLHTDDLFRQTLPALHDRVVRAFWEADEKGGWGVLAGKDASRLNLRTVEFHEYGRGGQLSDPGHYDAGSLITLDVMLAEPGVDFEGGGLLTPNQDGSVSSPARFGKGDAVCFVSHKRHNVAPVEGGRRRVLVAELWEGPPRTCAHRCLSTGPCSYSLSRSHVASSAEQLALLG